jgi:phage FluMu protein Com
MMLYQVRCGCGHILSGTRQQTYQIVRCPRCGSERFIFGCPAATEAGGSVAGPVHARPARRRFRRLMLGVCGVLLLGLGIVLHAILSKRENPLPDNVVPAQERLERAERLLVDGNFRLAAIELGKPDTPANAAPKLRNRWRQVFRESSILADLLPEPLEEVLQHAAASGKDEWYAVFAHRYADKAMLLDIVVSRAATGKLTTNYQWILGDEPIRVEMDELQLLQSVNLEKPRRVILGARLASVRLEAPGPGWVVRFHPQSGVLLTNAQAAGWVCPALRDAESVELLNKQRRLCEEAH